MPNSFQAAKQLLKDAAASAALPEEKSVTWDLGKRWDCMNAIETLQQKLSKMAVHSVLIMVAENPLKKTYQKKCVLQETLLNFATTVQKEKHLLSSA
jgi:hypothetical protein